MSYLNYDDCIETFKQENDDIVETFGCFHECTLTQANDKKELCYSWCRTPLGPYRDSCWARECDGEDLKAWCDNGLGMGIGVQKSCEGCCATTGIEYQYKDLKIVPRDKLPTSY